MKKVNSKHTNIIFAKFVKGLTLFIHLPLIPQYNPIKLNNLISLGR